MKLGDPQEVGKLMREMRLKRGWSQQQMAAQIGVSPITIMRIELGRVGYIHESTAKKLEAMQVPVKLTNRLVAVPMAVMHDGTTRTLEEVKATAVVTQDGTTRPILGSAPHTRAMRMHESGDIVEAVPSVMAVKQAAKALERQANGGELGSPSRARRFLLWLASKV